MQRNERLQVVIGERRVAAHIGSPTQVVEGHEGTVRSNEGEPEMGLAQGVVHHSSGHLWEPEVRSGEDSENCGHAHDHVEVSNDEVRCMQHDVDGWLSEEEATNSASDKHGNKTERKKRRGIDADF